VAAPGALTAHWRAPARAITIEGEPASRDDDRRRMDPEQREPEDERREYEPPELTVLASVEEATLMGAEAVQTSDGTSFSGF
jgi:hypothetical protein